MENGQGKKGVVTKTYVLISKEQHKQFRNKDLIAR